MATISAPFGGARIDAVLREATRTFGVPVALLSPAATETARSAYASAPVTSAAGEQLATLCILDVPDGPVPPSTAARLNDLASRCADALDLPALVVSVPPASPATASAPRSPPRDRGSRS